MATKLTKAQLRFLHRLLEDDGFGPVRWMHAGQRKTGYALKDKGLVEFDGAISSSLTEGNEAFNGMTFAITNAGRTALSNQGGGNVPG